jgi:hypothetical protein
VQVKAVLNAEGEKIWPIFSTLALGGVGFKGSGREFDLSLRFSLGRCHFPRFL